MSQIIGVCMHEYCSVKHWKLLYYFKPHEDFFIFVHLRKTSDGSHRLVVLFARFMVVQKRKNILTAFRFFKKSLTTILGDILQFYTFILNSVIIMTIF